MSDLLIFNLFCGTAIIIHGFALYKAIKTKDERFWSFFKGIFLGIILSSLIGFFVSGSFDEDCSGFGGWGWLYYFRGIGIMSIVGFIVTIIGFIIKSKINKNNKIIKADKICKRKIVMITSAIIIITFLLTLIIPYQINLSNFKKLEIYAKEYLENYLNDEYGEKNYKIISFERDYSYNGIISQSFSGFEATIHLNNMTDYIKDMEDYRKEYFYKQDSFKVVINGKNKNTLTIGYNELAIDY